MPCIVHEVSTGSEAPRLATRGWSEGHWEATRWASPCQGSIDGPRGLAATVKADPTGPDAMPAAEMFHFVSTYWPAYPWPVVFGTWAHWACVTSTPGLVVDPLPPPPAQPARKQVTAKNAIELQPRRI